MMTGENLLDIFLNKAKALKIFCPQQPDKGTLEKKLPGRKQLSSSLSLSILFVLFCLTLAFLIKKKVL